MKMLEKTAKFFGVIRVKETLNQVRITGIDGTVMRKYLAKLFESDLPTKMMFSQTTDTSITIHRFFIPDFVYMLAELRHSKMCGWSGKRTIDSIVSGIMKNTWYSISIGAVKPMVDESRLNILKWTPMVKQMEFLHLYGDKIPRYDLRGYIVAFAPGGGKSFSACVVASCVIPPSIAQVKIIISPKKALHLVWEKTLKAVFKKPPTHWCSDSGTKMPLDNTEYYIFNFEQLDQAIELGKSLLSRGIRYFTIVDESHNFADYRSARTQKLVKLQTLQNNLYFLWISGSPVLKTAAELVSYLKCADPRFDEDAERRFRRIYSAAPGRANAIFNHRLGNMMAFIVPKSAFSTTKPTVKELPVRLPSSVGDKFLMSSVRKEMKAFIVERLKFYQQGIKENRRIVSTWFDYHETRLSTRAEKLAFRDYQKDLKMIMNAPDKMLTQAMASTRTYERTKLMPSIPAIERRKFKGALSAVKNIKLKVRGEALGTILSKRRAECAAALALYCRPEIILKESLSKTLFFSSSVLPVKVLGKYLEDQGFEPLLVFSDTNKNLTENIERFTTDPNVNPICATMASLSEAVPVTAASTVVLLNRPFRQAVYDQVIARADRLGQEHPVTIIEVTLDTGDEPNVSSTTDDILANVRELINEIVGKDFAGPDPDEREYLKLIDASKAHPIIIREDEKIGL